jgi:uncharacterized protein YjbI with pentapeptide repeats
MSDPEYEIPNNDDISPDDIQPEADLSHADLSGSDLGDADLSGSDLIYSDMSEANLNDADLSEANLSQADLSRANLSHTDLSGGNLSHADLLGADLSYADLSEAFLNKVDLSEADLRFADLSEAVLIDSDLSDAYLYEADLSEAYLSYVDLLGADLSYSDLSGSDLGDADLSGADLSYADLSGANLHKADLSGADLHEADLSEANLNDADLSEANLNDADLLEANLRNADLDGVVRDTDFEQANLVYPATDKVGDIIHPTPYTPQTYWQVPKTETDVYFFYFTGNNYRDEESKYRRLDENLVKHGAFADRCEVICMDKSAIPDPLFYSILDTLGIDDWPALVISRQSLGFEEISRQDKHFQLPDNTDFVKLERGIVANKIIGDSDKLDEFIHDMEEAAIMGESLKSTAMKKKISEWLKLGGERMEDIILMSASGG